MNIQSLLGNNVRHIREAKGWSQDKLSDESGLHRTYISGIERGVRNPTIEIIHKISLALRVTVSDLLKDKEGK